MSKSRDEYYVFFLETVRKYIDNIIRTSYKTADVGGIFADGIEIESGKHVRWNFPDGESVAISDIANEQNLLRTLVGLSNLTGEGCYKQYACDALRHIFSLQHSCGLLEWGGHRFIDYDTMKIVGIKEKKGDVHELKNCFPYYELMYEVDREATEKYIEAFWNAHVYRWETLEINRHGYYVEKDGRLWANEFNNPDAFSCVKGLSFLNAGNDLMYAAGQLFINSKKKGAIIWLIRMARQYAKARNQDTMLGAYQYNQSTPIARTDDDSDTASRYGDRAKRQLGDDFGDRALEGKMLLKSHAKTIYYNNAMIFMELGLNLGNLGKELIDIVRSGLNAYAKYGYNYETNEFKPMLTDGTSLDGYVLKKDGYYGKKGDVLSSYKADDEFLLSYTRAYVVTGDEEIGKVAYNIAKSLGLGSFDETSEDFVNLNCDIKSEKALFAVLDLYKHFNDERYLKLAIHIGENIVNGCVLDGYFVPDLHNKYVDFDNVMPLALLELCEVLAGKKDLVPSYISGSGYIHGNYLMKDGTSKSYTTHELYDEKK